MGGEETYSQGPEVPEGHCRHVLGRHQEKEGAEARVAQTGAGTGCKGIKGTYSEETSCWRKSGGQAKGSSAEGQEGWNECRRRKGAQEPVYSLKVALRRCVRLSE